jgi:hypothetical protein
VCSFSCEGLAERGLGSLPGGDESVLVRGVRACSDAAWPGYDMSVLGAEKTEGPELMEVSEPAPFSTSPEPCSLSSGECALVLGKADADDDVLAAADADTEACFRRGAGDSVRRKPARLGERSSLRRVRR